MLDAAGKIWAKIQEFMGRIDKLEDHSEDAEADLKHLKRELELLRRETDREQHVTARVLEHHGLKIVDFEARIKELEKKNHSLATSAGIAKKKLEQMKDDPKGRRGPKGSKRGH
jgi:hypothetical protein